jgi:hypothetical protein
MFEIIQGWQKGFDDPLLLIGNGIGGLSCRTFLKVGVIGAESLKLTEQFIALCDKLFYAS